MISPENVPEAMGFSPRPNPRLIATFPTHGSAVAVSRGLDRDRVVDETGNQTVVFGRRGSRPFRRDEMEAFYRHYAGSTNLPARRTGELYQVEDVWHMSGDDDGVAGFQYAAESRMKLDKDVADAMRDGPSYIPTVHEAFDHLVRWVEKGIAPPVSQTVKPRNKLR